jgi:hypothetical protein
MDVFPTGTWRAAAGRCPAVRAVGVFDAVEQRRINGVVRWPIEQRLQSMNNF